MKTNKEIVQNLIGFLEDSYFQTSIENQDDIEAGLNFLADLEIKPKPMKHWLVKEQKNDLIFVMDIIEEAIYEVSADSALFPQLKELELRKALSVISNIVKS